ncbi:MAG: DNA replication complex GINS family protein [Crenarchaeota archaeon]|nr:DNA replication complex GINS family protein [Thermoproteota archaeon]MDW8033526.1 hypothetical protein [Nitrososphaerota archaeon]
MDSTTKELLSWIMRREFKRIRLKYELEETIVIPQVDSKSIKLPGLGEIVMEKGKSTRIYRGVANQLAESGWVKIGEERLTSKDIVSIRWLESSEEGFIKLPDFFYLKAMKIMKDNKGGKRIEIQNDLQEIVDIRLRKLFKLVFLKEIPTSIIERLQPEEVLLYSLLKETINIWQKELVYADGGQQNQD